MSAITPVTSMPANGASPSGMVTTSAAIARLQAICSDGAADLYLIQKSENGDWFRVPGAVLRVDSANADKAIGQILVPNPVSSTAFHVLKERSGIVIVHLSGVSSTTTVAEIAATTLTVAGNGTVAGTLGVTGALTAAAALTVGTTLGVTGAATLSSTLAVTGASTLTGQLSANGGEQLKGSSPSAAADAVGMGVADINGATTAALVLTHEGGGVSQQRVMSASATVKTMTWSESVLDDGTIALPAPTNLGRVRVTTYDEEAVISTKSDGTCTLLYGSANIDDADTDAKLCVYNNSGAPTVKNRLGGSRHVRVEYSIS